jgi:hypothetical protein
MFDWPNHSQITAASKYTHDKIHTSVSLHIKSGEICNGLTIDILLVEFVRGRALNENSLNVRMMILPLSPF